MFDVYAERMAALSRAYYRTEARLLAVDGIKVHLSPGGLLMLLKANVHVIGEPSKMSHIWQALDTPSAFGHYQSKNRSRVRQLAPECNAQGRAFTTIELVKAIGRPARDALCVDALKSAIRRVGMWPLDVTAVRRKDMSKGADAPLAPDLEIRILVLGLAAVARKDMVHAMVHNGGLSTAKRATDLTAPEEISALREIDADKADERSETKATECAKEERGVEKSVMDGERARAQKARMDDEASRMRREFWAVVAAGVATDPSCWLRLSGHFATSAAKARRRVAAARVRGSMMAPRAAWAQASRDAAKKAMSTSSKKNLCWFYLELATCMLGGGAMEKDSCSELRGSAIHMKYRCAHELQTLSRRRRPREVQRFSVRGRVAPNPPIAECPRRSEGSREKTWPPTGCLGNTAKPCTRTAVSSTRKSLI